MSKVKIESNYVARVRRNDKKEFWDEYPCILPDIDRVMQAERQGHTLACVIYEGDGGWTSSTKCALYYNEGGYSEEELRAAGYAIVHELIEVEVFEERKNVYKE